MKTSNITVFIVEDDKLYAEIIRNTLINVGYRKIEVFNSGSDYLNYEGQTPDLVILDHMLGQMSGIHVLKSIKDQQTNPEVIFLSAQEDMEVVVGALKLGAFDYIEKTDKHAMTRLTVMMEKALRAKAKKSKNMRIERLKAWFLIN